MSPVINRFFTLKSIVAFSSVPNFCSYAGNGKWSAKKIQLEKPQGPYAITMSPQVVRSRVW